MSGNARRNALHMKELYALYTKDYSMETAGYRYLSLDEIDELTYDPQDITIQPRGEQVYVVPTDAILTEENLKRFWEHIGIADSDIRSQLDTVAGDLRRTAELVERLTPHDLFFDLVRDIRDYANNIEMETQPSGHWVIDMSIEYGCELLWPAPAKDGQS